MANNVISPDDQGVYDSEADQLRPYEDPRHGSRDAASQRQQEINQLNQAYYRPSAKTSGSQIAPENQSGLGLGSEGKGKKQQSQVMMAALAVVGPSIVGLVLVFLAQMAGIRLLHIDNLVNSYRIASLQHQMVKRVKHIATVNYLADFEGGSYPEFTNSSLRQKFVAGWTPEKFFSALGENDLRPEFDRTGVFNRENRMTAVLDYGNLDADGRPARYDLSTVDGTRSFGSVIESRFANDTARKRSFIRNSRNYVHKVNNVKLSRFRSFLANIGENLTPAKRRALHAEDKYNNRTQAGNSSLDIINDQVDAEAEDYKQNGSVSKTRNPKLAAMEAKLKVVGTISDAVFFTTIGCIIRDLADQTTNVIRGNIEGYINYASGFSTMADQIRVGDITQDAQAAEIEYWDEGFAATAEYQMSSNSSVVDYSNSLRKNLYSHLMLGMDAETVAEIAELVEDNLSIRNVALPGIGSYLDDIPYIGSWIEKGDDKLTDELCNVLLDPRAQTAIAVGELGLTVFTIGVGKAAGVSIKQTIKQILKGSLYGLGLEGFLYQVAMPWYVSQITGINTLPEVGDSATNFQKLSHGKLLEREATALASGGSLLKTEVVAAQDRKYMQEYIAYEKSRGLTHNLFALDNPFSVASTAFAHMPVTLTGLQTSFGSLFGGVFGGGLVPLVSSASAYEGSYDPGYEYYDRPYLVGFLDEEIEGVAKGFSHDANTAYVEPRLDELKDKYQDCLTLDMYAVVTGDSSVNKCNDEDARHYKMYALDCMSIDAVGYERSSTSAYFSDGCSDITGQEYRSYTEVVSTSTYDNPTVSVDQNGCPQSPVTNDADIVLISPSYGDTTIRVHRCIADETLAMLEAAYQDGIELNGGGYRSNAAQISLRRAHCGTSNYAIYQMPASLCKPPTARPGFSNHEKGLAIDFTYNGRSITSRSSPAFVWMADNAERFGFYNLPSEPWHWSINGQ